MSDINQSVESKSEQLIDSALDNYKVRMGLPIDSVLQGDHDVAVHIDILTVDDGTLEYAAVVIAPDMVCRFYYGSDGLEYDFGLFSEVAEIYEQAFRRLIFRHDLHLLVIDGKHGMFTEVINPAQYEEFLITMFDINEHGEAEMSNRTLVGANDIINRIPWLSTIGYNGEGHLHIYIETSTNMVSINKAGASPVELDTEQ